MKQKILIFSLILVLVLSVLSFTPGVLTTVLAEGEVCAIGETQYATLDAALDAVPAGGATATTIKLLQDIDYAGGITVANKKITFDLDGKTLSVDNTAGIGLTVTNGSVIDITNPGAFNARGSETGLSASSSTVKVTNVNSNTLHGINASNSDITVTNNVTSASHMAVAASGGSEISIGGNVSGANYGVYAQDADTAITVTGNVSATDDNSYGVHSRGGAAVSIQGNVTATGSNSTGANLNTGGTLTVDGIITAQSYIMFGTVVKTAADITTPTTKSGYNTYTDGTSTVWVKAYVAEIGGIPYATLDEALAEVGTGETGTIKLLADINYDKGISITGGRNITFNLSGFTLAIENTDVTDNEGIGLLVTNGSVDYTGSGEFNVIGVSCGVSANGGSASATVTNATATADGGNGAVAINSGDIVVNDNTQGGYNGVFVANTGSTAVVNGNATGTASDSSGARAHFGGSVTINGGTAQGVRYGTYANGSDSHITINGGDAIGTGPYSFGVHAEIDGTIHVTGNTQGTQYGVYSSDGTSVVVTGNATVTAEVNGWGVNAQSGGTIVIGGNVVANGSSLGAFVTSGGEITIDGAILASSYIQIFDDIAETYVNIDGSVGSRTIPTTKAGYFTYSASTSTIWVKEAAPADTTPPVWTSGCPYTNYVLDDELGLVVSADENCTVYYVVLVDGAAAPSADQVQNQLDAGGNEATGGYFSYTNPPNSVGHYVGGLTPETAYDIYVVLKDGVGNLQVAPARIDVTTLPETDTDPADENSGITGQLPGPNGSRQVTLTVTLQNAAGEALTGRAVGDFSVSIDGASAVHFVSNPSFSGFVNNGDGTYTVVFTGDADATAYSFTNLSVNGTIIEAGPTTVTTPPTVPEPDTTPPSGTPAPTPPPTVKAVVAVNASETTIPVNVNSTAGSGMVNLEPSMAESLFSGQGTAVITVPSIPGVNAYTLEMPVSAISSGQTGGALTFSTDVASITITDNMLTGVAGFSGNEAAITIGQGDKTNLPADVKAALGDRPLVQLTLTTDGRQVEWNNPDAPVTVSIPYTPTAHELADPEHITIWYIDGKGNVVEVPSGRYGPATGTVTFTTTHFSNYAVVYVTKTFGDLGSVAWAEKPIEVLASKGILRGISESKYSPQTNITRADFLYFMVRTLGVDASIDRSFDDISSSAYYYKEIGIAKNLGITNGTGNNKFNPDASITRQDMMVLTERALRMLKKLGQQGTASDLEKFADKSLVAAYAINGVASVVKEELIVGSGDNINPLGNTTRAEAAVFLYRIYNKYYSICRLNNKLKVYPHMKGM